MALRPLRIPAAALLSLSLAAAGIATAAAASAAAGPDPSGPEPADRQIGGAPGWIAQTPPDGSLTTGGSAGDTITIDGGSVIHVDPGSSGFIIINKPPRLVCRAALKTTASSPAGLLAVTLTNTGGGPAPAGGQYRWTVLALRASGSIRLTAPLAIGQSQGTSALITKPVPTPPPPYACTVSAVVPGAAF